MVHVADSENPANLAYYSVLAVGVVGARAGPTARARTGSHVVRHSGDAGADRILLPSGAPPDMARRMAIGHGLFVALFTASGLLCRHASLTELK
jgi:hypothetical protein